MEGDDTTIRIKKMYITIDSLLDVKFALLHKVLDGLDEDYAVGALAAYGNRISDYFMETEHSDELRRLYKERGREDFASSVESNMVVELYNECLCTKRHCNGLDLPYKNEVILNTYPYRFTDKETDLIVTSILNSHNFDNLEIKPVYIELNKITPNWLQSQHVTIMVDVDGEEWLYGLLGNPNFDEFKDRCPEIRLTLPMILTKEVEDPESAMFDHIEGTKASLHDNLSFHFSEMIELEYVDSEYFSPRVLSETLRDQ